MKPATPKPNPRRPRRRPSLTAAGVLAGLLVVGVAPAHAANNPGTGDTGFFTFRPATVAGTQINVASGNALIRTRDLADGLLTYHVVVDRSYNSLASGSDFSILSPRWGFDVGPDTKLTVESNQDATVRGPSGYRIRFERQSDGSYVAPSGFDGSLTKTSSGWTLTRTSQNDAFGFDGSGTLTWTKDSELRDFTVQGTSAAGRTVLSSYGTNSGRRVNLSYNGDSLVRLMDDPASGHHWYRYTSGKLTEYESPTGAKTTYGYDSNGFLDEITEPGGTTVQLDVLASGKISSITTTLPGGVPQTTGFVYTRRTYKSDVTAPDSTRRTYAYDGDWRVTRDYDPDVVPTVIASGQLRNLENDYVGPNQTYALTVAADQPDGAGLRRLSVERASGEEIEGEDVPCTSTPFDLVCPTQRTASLDVDFASVPEGEQAIRAAAHDDEEHHAISDGWKVLVDKSAPTLAGNLGGAMEEGTSQGSIYWDAFEDPSLPDGTLGSGVLRYDYQLKRAGGTWSSWAQTAASEVERTDLIPGETIELRVKAVDLVGNESATYEDEIQIDPVPVAVTPGETSNLGGESGPVTSGDRATTPRADRKTYDLGPFLYTKEAELSEEEEEGGASLFSVGPPSPNKFFSSGVDNAHLANTPPRPAMSVHGWWEKMASPATHARVTIALQQYNNGWVTVARRSQVIGPGTGGRGARVTARRRCVSYKGRTYSYRGVVDVDIVGWKDPPNKETSDRVTKTNCSTLGRL